MRPHTHYTCPWCVEGCRSYIFQLRHHLKTLNLLLEFAINVFIYNIASPPISLGSWNDILSKEGKKRAPEKKCCTCIIIMELRMYYRLTRYFSYMKKKINKFPDLTNKLSLLISFIIILLTANPCTCKAGCHYGY